MCALTTSTGFLSLTISPVPMVRQAGIIISIGVVLAFFLTLVITAFFLPKLLNFNKFNFLKTNEDLLERFIKTYFITGFNKPTLSVWLGVVFIIAMVWAIPEIQTVKHLTNSTIKNTREAKDLEYIEQYISTGTSFSVILQPLDGILKTKRFWYDLIQYEKEIKSIPGIQGVESITPLVFRVALKLSLGGIKPEKVFEQIQAQSHENDMLRSYYNPITKKMRIIVHIQSKTSDQVETILRRVKKETEKAFAKKAEVTLSGQLLLLRSQTTDLVSSQMRTLILALFVITILMMIQLRSIVLGLLSLIPNLFPLISIFGIMGWFHIPLDPLTIFAAVISFGLSVDDSIHYLAQLKREMSVKKNSRNIHGCLKIAYYKNARALVSTTAVLFFSALGLLFSSFNHVFSLGVLISSASIIALVGDLVFMPAAVLKFKPLNYLLSLKLRETVL
jgi:predicted RND superfamily exporter protein